MWTLNHTQLIQSFRSVRFQSIIFVCFCSNTSHGLWKSNFICERYIEQWMSLALHHLPNIHRSHRRQGHDCAVALHIHRTNVKHSRWQSAWYLSLSLQIIGSSLQFFERFQLRICLVWPQTNQQPFFILRPQSPKGRSGGGILFEQTRRNDRNIIIIIIINNNNNDNNDDNNNTKNTNSNTNIYIYM